MVDKKLAVLVSGSGSNLQAIIDAVKDKTLKNTEISIVVSNKENVFALERAKKAGIKTLFLNPKNFQSNEEYDKKIVETINDLKVDLVVLAGYLKILSPVLINAFSGKIINIHPALLPDFGGKGMYGKYVHEAVLKSGIKESGCTVHFVTNEIDKGPIISQTKVCVLENDSVETLSARILKEEHKLLVDSIKKILFHSPVGT